MAHADRRRQAARGLTAPSRLRPSADSLRHRRWRTAARPVYGGAMDKLVESTPPARVPFPTVLASIVGLWACYFALVSLRSLALDLGFEQEMLWRRGLVCLAG